MGCMCMGKTLILTTLSFTPSLMKVVPDSVGYWNTVSGA